MKIFENVYRYENSCNIYGLFIGIGVERKIKKWQTFEINEYSDQCGATDVNGAGGCVCCQWVPKSSA